jgi:hypothetical protein
MPVGVYAKVKRERKKERACVCVRERVTRDPPKRESEGERQARRKEAD